MVESVTYTNEEMRKLAEEYGGRCLTDRPLSIDVKMRWQCKNGHEWESSFSDIIDGKGCPECKDKTDGDSDQSET